MPSAHVQRQLDALGVKPAPKNRPHASQAAQATTDTGEAENGAPATVSERNPGRDAPPAMPAAVPLRWQVAGGLYAEQHPGAFRLVVVGEAHRLPEVLAALGKLDK